MADKIGTWSQINSSFGTSGSPSNKCPSEAEVTATGKIKLKFAHTDSRALPPFSFLESSRIINTYTYISPASVEIGISGFQYGAASQLSVSGFFTDSNRNTEGLLMITGRGTFTGVVNKNAIRITNINKKFTSGVSGGVTDLTTIIFSPSQDDTYEYRVNRIS